MQQCSFKNKKNLAVGVSIAAIDRVNRKAQSQYNDEFLRPREHK